MSCVLELSLPEDLRIFGAPLRWVARCSEPCRELTGLVGEVLRCLPFEFGVFLPSLDPAFTRPMLCGLPTRETRLWSTSGEMGVEKERASSAYLPFGLAEGHGCPVVEGVEGMGALDERRRRLSMSSSTMFNSRSMGSSTFARRTVRLRICSASLSQP